MSESWYYQSMGKELGPVSSKRLKQLAESGVIVVDTMVRRSQEEPWIPASRVRGLFDPSNQTHRAGDATHPKETEVSKVSSPKPVVPKKKSLGSISFQLAVIICLLLMGMGFPWFSSLRPTSRWEYKIVSPYDSLFENSMNVLGNDGWELVFARRATSSSGASYEMILKRPR